MDLSRHHHFVSDKSVTGADTLRPRSKLVASTSKLVASGLCRLLSGFPLFSEAIQVAYSNPERTLSRKRPPRCPSSKPSSMGGRSRKNDIIDHPVSPSYLRVDSYSRHRKFEANPGEGRHSGLWTFSIDSPKCVSHVQPLPHTARCGEVRASFP